MRYSGAVAVILMAGSLFVTGGRENGGPIRHPVRWYERHRPCPECRKDSVLQGTITFDPLPEYMKESRMVVEYYCQEDIAGDLTLRLDEYQKEFEISAYEQIWPGPVRAGDTLLAEFQMTPMKVGVVIVTFKVYDPEVYEFPDSTMAVEIPRGQFIAAMVLGPDGKVKALNSAETNEEYATFLGPYPEVMAESLIFWRDPKLPAELAESSGFWRNPYMPAESGDKHGYPMTMFKYFSIKTVLYTQPDDSGYRHVRCEVTPYHVFESGVAIALSASDDVTISNVPPSFPRAVAPSDTVRFSFAFRIDRSGQSCLHLNALTHNPDEGNPFGGVGLGSAELWDMQPIHIGYDSSMKLLFITGENPANYLPRMSRDQGEIVPDRLIKQREADRRVQWLESQPPRKAKWVRYYGEGYSNIID